MLCSAHLYATAYEPSKTALSQTRCYRWEGLGWWILDPIDLTFLFGQFRHVAESKLLTTYVTRIPCRKKAYSEVLERTFTCDGAYDGRCYVSANYVDNHYVSGAPDYDSMIVVVAFSRPPLDSPSQEPVLDVEMKQRFQRMRTVQSEARGTV